MVGRLRAVKVFANRPSDICALSADTYPIDVLLLRESEPLELPPHVCVTQYQLVEYSWFPRIIAVTVSR